MTRTTLSRRTFIRTSLAAGGGLMIGFHMPASQAAKDRAEALDGAARRASRSMPGSRSTRTAP